MSAAIDIAHGEALGAETRWDRFKVEFGKWWRGDIEDMSPGPVACSSAQTASRTTAEVSAPAAPLPTKKGISAALHADGIAFPGGVDYALELIKTLNLTKTSTLLDLGCGQGDTSRAAHQRFGAWVTGMDLSADLARLGQDVSTAMKIERAVPIQHLDPANPGLPDGKFDAACARFVLSPIVDKAHLLDKVTRAMKRGALLLLVDYFMPEIVQSPERFAAWQAAENCPEQPFSMDEYRRVMSDLGFEIRVCEDIGDAFRERVVAGWKSFSADLGDAQLPPADRALMARNLRLWGARLAALKSGDLGVTRILAVLR